MAYKLDESAPLQIDSKRFTRIKYGFCQAYHGISLDENDGNRGTGRDGKPIVNLISSSRPFDTFSNGCPLRSHPVIKLCPVVLHCPVPPRNYPELYITVPSHR